MGGTPARERIQRAKARHRHRVVAVHDGRAQPLEQRRVRLAHQAQRLAQVPAVDVEVAADRHLDHVATRCHSEVPRQAVDVDEAHVVVAVGRGKAPAAAAGFAGEQHGHFMRQFDVAQGFHDLRAHRGLDRMGGAQEFFGAHFFLLLFFFRQARVTVTLRALSNS
jgi:hypothetical protein